MQTKLARPPSISLAAINLLCQSLSLICFHFFIFCLLIVYVSNSEASINCNFTVFLSRLCLGVTVPGTVCLTVLTTQPKSSYISSSHPFVQTKADIAKRKEHNAGFILESDILELLYSKSIMMLLCN